MDKMMTLFCESAEYAFFLGTLLYGMFFVGDLLISKFNAGAVTPRRDRVGTELLLFPSPSGERRLDRAGV